MKTLTRIEETQIGSGPNSTFSQIWTDGKNYGHCTFRNGTTTSGRYQSAGNTAEAVYNCIRLVSKKTAYTRHNARIA